MQEDVLEMEELELDGNFDQPLALGAPGPSGPPGPPGPSGVTPHIGANGNWFIGEEDTGVSAGGSGSGGNLDAYVEGETLVFTESSATIENETLIL